MIEEIVALQVHRQRRADAWTDDIVFFDRSPICTWALCEYAGRAAPDSSPRRCGGSSARGPIERRVFFVRNLGFVTPTEARRITFEDSLRFEAIHAEVYRRLGYELVDVPGRRRRTPGNGNRRGNDSPRKVGENRGVLTIGLPRRCYQSPQMKNAQKTKVIGAVANRARQIRLKIALAALIGAVFNSFTGVGFAVGWCGVYVASQLAEAWVLPSQPSGGSPQAGATPSWSGRWLRRTCCSARSASRR